MSDGALNVDIVYCGLMEDVKARLTLLRHITNASLHHGDESFDTSARRCNCGS
jgi:hypothetical protein